MRSRSTLFALVAVPVYQAEKIIHLSWRECTTRKALISQKNQEGAANPFYFVKSKLVVNFTMKETSHFSLFTLVQVDCF